MELLTKVMTIQKVMKTMINGFWVKLEWSGALIGIFLICNFRISGVFSFIITERRIKLCAWVASRERIKSVHESRLKSPPWNECNTPEDRHVYFKTGLVLVSPKWILPPITIVSTHQEEYSHDIFVYVKIPQTQILVGHREMRMHPRGILSEGFDELLATLWLVELLMYSDMQLCIN